MNVSQIVAKGITANNLQGGTIVNIASVVSFESILDASISLQMNFLNYC